MTTHHHTQSLQGNTSTCLDDIKAELMGEFHFNTSLIEQECYRQCNNDPHRQLKIDP